MFNWNVLIGFCLIAFSNGDSGDVEACWSRVGNVTKMCPGGGRWCCVEGRPMCCLSSSKWFFEIDKTLATTIALSVTFFSMFVTIAIVVCCFWSKCPLYTTCRVHYTAEKDGERATSEMATKNGLVASTAV